jgi:hypothetical protein
VWPWLRPYIDSGVRNAARQLGLPHTDRALRDLAGRDDLSVLGAALIHAAH